jgi:hypothetical protein
VTLTEIAQAQKDKEAASEQAELRKEFAKAALTGLLAGNLYYNGEQTYIGNAREALAYADAMLEAMKSSGKQ